MAKRRLSKQQIARIKHRQASSARRAKQDSNDLDAKIQPSNFDANTHELRSPPEQQFGSEQQLGPEQEGIVISRFGTQVDVQPSLTNNTIHRCYIRANLSSAVVTGDSVIWQAGSKQDGVVSATLPRSTELSRPDNRGNSKIIAANVSQMVIVAAIEPEPINHLIDRYLVAAHQQKLKPLIVLNKVDLINKPGRFTQESVDKLLNPYRQIGYPVLTLSTQQENPLAELEDHLNNNISVFTGQSGVGKSSIINALLPEVNTAVGEVSEATGKGTHTTTAARLYPLEHGGAVIDSPGIREMGLWIQEGEQLEAYFPEFHPFNGLCRFRDCKHENEPGCALREALDKKDISAERFKSFKRMRSSLTPRSEKTRSENVGN